MDDLNYHHLRYFWAVAREGSIARACSLMDVAQPTVSAQIRLLERDLGESLFQREGRHLTLTDAGRIVFRYADEIFGLGHELRDALRNRPGPHPLRLTVGVVDALPKLVVYQLLEPALRFQDPAVRLICFEGKSEDLLAELARHQLDLVLTDAPLSPGASVKAYNHQLGDCGISVMGSSELAKALTGPFPEGIEAIPWLLPTYTTTLRRSLEAWFQARCLRPWVVGEFEDSALIKAFGQAKIGAFAIPKIIELEVQRQYAVELIGHIEDVRERFYAITVERRLRHPAVVAICEAARRKLIG